MTTLEMRMNVGPPVQSTSDSLEQSSHSSSPTHFNTPSKGEEIVMVVAVLMILIYGTKVLGRILKHEK